MAASLSAYPAVLVVFSMLLTLLTAKTAGSGIGFESRAHHLGLEGHLPRENSPSRGAHLDVSPKVQNNLSSGSASC